MKIQLKLRLPSCLFVSMEDSLVLTRARRANAGSRLKQLLELEEQAADIQSSVGQIITEDDENVNLLFQEDADDQEFMELQLEEEEEEEEVEEGDGDGDGEEAEGEASSPTPGRELDQLLSEDEVKIDSDDVLSDSEMSLSDTDEEEGEKQLQEQEKIKKRKIKKSLSYIPAIKKAKTDPIKQPRETPVKKPKSDMFSSESMLLSLRRSSSRAAAVENKQAVVKRLKESEKRRAAQVPVVRIKERELTQEERLEEAIETEKANVLSLNQFREQEIVKNEYRKQLLLLKRAKLKNVVRFITKETLVTPLDDINQARIVYELNNPKSKSGRRKKGTFSFDTDPNPRLPGKVDPELPYYRKEMEEKEKQEAEEKREDSNYLKEGKDEELKQGEEEHNEEPNDSKEEEDKEQTSNEEGKGEKEKEKEDNAKLKEKDEGLLSEANGEMTDSESIDQGIKMDDEEKETVDIEMNVEDQANGEKTQEIDGDSGGKMQQTTANQQESENSEESEDGDKIDSAEGAKIEHSENKQDNINSESPIKETQGSEANRELKRVKFNLDEPSQEPPSSKGTPIPENSIEVEENNIVFEGPAHKVARNMIYLIDFDEDDRNMRLSDQNVKAILFGEQATLPASRFLTETTTILKIGNVENPYAIVKEERDEMFESIDDITEDSAMFDELKRLPRLGVAEEFVEEEEEDTKEEEAIINIKTEAPTGLYLPNGNKKNCLITGAEVKYFDPSNGMPYSSVETYKVLKAIEQGNIPWYNVTSEFNSWGGAEVYLGSRDGSVRHAKGVPEGFDDSVELES